MFSFLAILLNCTDWAITGRIARVQFNSTLERKVKTGALKGIFLVGKWINNTLKSNSVRYHMHHWKNLSFLSSFGLRAVFVKGSKIAVFVSIVTSKRAWWPPLFITFLSSSWLVTSVYQASSTIYVRFLLLGNHLKIGIPKSMVFGPFVDCEQSLFFFRFSRGSAHARASGEAARRAKRGRQPEKKKRSLFSCLSHLAPSVSRVAIRVSRVLLDGLQKKERLLVV